MHEHTGWIGVDLDKTLAVYDNDISKVGAPIKPMVDRVNRWIAEGKSVKIFTARVYTVGDPIGNKKRDQQLQLIRDWCQEVFGKELPITCQKDPQMVELWDDRAVSVAPNTGEKIGGGLLVTVDYYQDSFWMVPAELISAWQSAKEADVLLDGVTKIDNPMDYRFNLL